MAIVITISVLLIAAGAVVAYFVIKAYLEHVGELTERSEANVADRRIAEDQRDQALAELIDLEKSRNEITVMTNALSEYGQKLDRFRDSILADIAIMGQIAGHKLALAQVPMEEVDLHITQAYNIQTSAFRNAIRQGFADAFTSVAVSGVAAYVPITDKTAGDIARTTKEVAMLEKVWRQKAPASVESH